MCFSAASRRAWVSFSAIEARCWNAGCDGVNGGGGNNGRMWERYEVGSGLGVDSRESSTCGSVLTGEDITGTSTWKSEECVGLASA